MNLVPETPGPELIHSFRIKYISRIHNIILKTTTADIEENIHIHFYTHCYCTQNA